MAEKTVERRQTVREEVANSISHGVAAGLSIAALSVLVALASVKGDPWRIVAFSIYGASLVLLYTASTLYHSIPWPSVKRHLRRLDHASIYLLIAGTYTPFTLVCMRNRWGWTMFGVVWGIAAFGVVFKTFFTGRFDVLSTLLYLAMGWIALIAVKPILESVPSGAIFWMALGGLSYTLGVVFYAWQRIPYHHTIWHGFVIGGSLFHFFAMVFFVLPDAS